MKIYLAGPMRGIAEFNFPMFHAGTAALRAEGHEVFSPAERDIRVHGDTFSKSNPTGDNAVAEEDHGFNLREALADDLDWICRHADAVVLLPGWANSTGARAERATAGALGLKVFELPADATRWAHAIKTTIV